MTLKLLQFTKVHLAPLTSFGENLASQFVIQGPKLLDLNARNAKNSCYFHRPERHTVGQDLQKCKETSSPLGDKQQKMGENVENIKFSLDTQLNFMFSTYSPFFVVYSIEGQTYHIQV